MDTFSKFKWKLEKDVVNFEETEKCLCDVWKGEQERERKKEKIELFSKG